MKWISLSCLAIALLIAAAPLAADKDDKMPGLTVDKAKRTITLDCKVAPRKIDDPAFKDIYPIEVVACWPWRKDPPGGQKAHETIVTMDFAVKPSEIQKALEGLGLKPGMPVKGDGEPKGPEVKILLDFTDVNGQPKKIPVERTLVAKDNPKLKLPEFKWRFTGSALKAPDPEKPDVKVSGADISGTLISVFPVTDDTIFQTQMTMKEEKFLKLEANDKLLPKIGTPVKLIIEAPEK